MNQEQLRTKKPGNDERCLILVNNIAIKAREQNRIQWCAQPKVSLDTKVSPIYMSLVTPWSVWKEELSIRGMMSCVTSLHPFSRMSCRAISHGTSPKAIWEEADGP